MVAKWKARREVLDAGLRLIRFIMEFGQQLLREERNILLAGQDQEKNISAGSYFYILRLLPKILKGSLFLSAGPVLGM